jgi:hypothetical protein
MTFSKVAQQLVDFVFRDQRFKQLGVRGGAAVAFREISGREPLKEEDDQVVRDFWQVWHEKFDNSRFLPPVGGGSPHYILEELSPWQENAIRALEECDGCEPGATTAQQHE